MQSNEDGGCRFKGTRGYDVSSGSYGKPVQEMSWQPKNKRYIVDGLCKIISIFKVNSYGDMQIQTIYNLEEVWKMDGIFGFVIYYGK